MMTPPRILPALVVFFGLTTSADAATLYAGPNGYPTIQSAVDAARPGDVVQVHPYKWHESVRITKALTIEKAPGTTGTPWIVGTSSGALQIDVQNGEPITVRNILLMGSGGPVVRGPSLSATRAATVIMRNTRLYYGYAGVTGFMHLAMTGGGVHHITGPGISIFGTVNLDGVSVHDTAGNGIWLTPWTQAGAINWIRNTSVARTGSGCSGQVPCAGIRINGNHGPTLWMSNVEVDDATGAGIFLDRAHGATLDAVVIERTWADNGSWGDGLVAYRAIDIRLTSSWIMDSERAGVTAFGCTTSPAELTLHDVQLWRNPIQLGTEAAGACTKDANILDDGENECYDNTNTKRPCQVISSNLEAAEPPPVYYTR